MCFAFKTELFFTFPLRSAPLMFPFRNPLCLPCRTTFTLSTTSAALTHLLTLYKSTPTRLDNAHCLAVGCLLQMFCSLLLLCLCPSSLFTTFGQEKKKNPQSCLEWACKSFLKHIFLPDNIYFYC